MEAVLSIGLCFNLAYRTNEGQPWVLPVVHSVEAQMAVDPLLNHEYLPILGTEDFCVAAMKICLGSDSPAIVENRVSMYKVGFLQKGNIYCFSPVLFCQQNIVCILV